MADGMIDGLGKWWGYEGDVRGAGEVGGFLE